MRWTTERFWDDSEIWQECAVARNTIYEVGQDDDGMFRACFIHWDGTELLGRRKSESAAKGLCKRHAEGLAARLLKFAGWV